MLAAAVLAIVGATAGARLPATTDAIDVAPNASQSAAWASPSPPQPAAPSPTPLGALGPPSARQARRTSSLADAGAEPSPGVTADGRVILNIATEDELTRLPGIGPVRARAIVALRQRLAKFRAVEDLLRVKGIGRKTLRRIKPNVVLDRPLGSDGGPP
jgi:competence protein ComEA